MDFDAAGNLSHVLLSGVAGQSYSALELDYDGGTYTGYRAFYTATEGSYNAEEVDVSAATNEVTRVVYSGLDAATYPYSSLEETFSGGALVSQTYNFTNVGGQGFHAYHVTEDAAGNPLQETLDNNDGTHNTIGFADGQTLVSRGDDLFTGGGAGETFVFNRIYGHAEITDFGTHLAGAGHDTISLPAAEFADFNAMLAATHDVGANAVIESSDGDSVVLDNVSLAMLSTASPDDFFFHA
jgi:hypothetical protein